MNLFILKTTYFIVRTFERKWKITCSLDICLRGTGFYFYMLIMKLKPQLNFSETLNLKFNLFSPPRFSSKYPSQCECLSSQTWLQPFKSMLWYVCGQCYINQMGHSIAAHCKANQRKIKCQISGRLACQIARWHQTQTSAQVPCTETQFDVSLLTISGLPIQVKQQTRNGEKLPNTGDTKETEATFTLLV